MAKKPATPSRHLGASNAQLVKEIERLERRLLVAENAAHERNRAETAPGQSEELFRRSFEDACVGTAIFDLECRYRAVNSAYCRALGYSRKELLGARFTDVLHPEDVDLGHGLLRQLMAGKRQPAKMEKRYLRKDGSVAWVSINASIVRDARGDAHHAIVHIQDVTDRKHAEKALRESEVQFRLLNESLPVLVASLDTKLRYRFANRAYREWFGLSEHDIVGKHVRTVLGQAAHRRIRPHLEASLGGRKVSAEVSLKRGDGAARTIAASYIPDCNEAGAVRGVIFLGDDITERKTIDDRLRLHTQIIEQTHDSVIATDREGRVTVWNKGAELMFGFSEQKALGRHISFVYPEDQREFLKNQVIAPTEKHGWCDIEVRMRRKSGKEFDAHLSNSILKNAAGETIGRIGVAIEISERKQAERVLRRNEERLSQFLENIADGIITIDEKGKIQSVNPAAEALFGYAAEEIVGRAVSSLMTGADRKRHQGYMRNYFETGKGKIIGIGPREVTGRRKDGSIFPASLSVGEMRIGDRRLFIGAVRDFTESKRMQEALRESEARLRLLTDALPVGICYLDTEYRYRFANKTYGEWHGIDPREIIGKKTGEVLGADAIKVTTPSVKLTLEGQPGNFEARVPYKSAGMLDVQIICVPHRDESGKILGAYGMVIDITERKRVEAALRQSESQLRLLADNMPVMIMSLDADLRFRFANRTYCKIHGIEPADLVGRNLQEMVDAVGFRKLRPSINAVLKGKTVEFETSYRFADGIERDVIANYVPEIDAHGAVRGFYVLLIDITERKRDEEALRCAKETAEYANRSKSEFLANMSHELRTPLSAIIGFAEMMCLETFGPVGGEQYQEYVRDIRDSGTHLLGLINDILDLAKVEAGKLEIYEEPLDVAESVTSCLRIVKERAKDNSIQLVSRLNGELPALFADDRKVKQIILNLLSNAVKFTPAGGKVTVDAKIEKGGCYALSVSDTGIGISAEDLSKVMTPFGQIDGSLSRKYDGTGLGLPLTKSLVDLHGGSVEFESELDCGTIVTIRFPAERVLGDPAKMTGDGAKAAAAR